MNSKTGVVVVGAVSVSLLGTALAVSHMKKKKLEQQNADMFVGCANELPVVNDLPQLSPEYLTLASQKFQKKQ
jgi:hypothetical protein